MGGGWVIRFRVVQMCRPRRSRCSLLSFLTFSRLHGAELIRVNEGEEPNDLCCLLGNKKEYISMINGMCLTSKHFVVSFVVVVVY